MDSIIPEFEKYVKPFLKKCDLAFFLLDKALSELRPKSLNKAPLKTTDCQYATRVHSFYVALSSESHGSIEFTKVGHCMF